MSLLPLIFRDMVRPLRMLERQMQMAEDFFHHPTTYQFARPRWALEFEEDQFKRDAVLQDKEKFQVKLDVQDFTPEEIVVKTIDGNAIQVEAKHEEKHGEDQGFISRQLVRKFVLPKGHDLKNALSSLSSDGILTITAPRIAQEVEERPIPITHEESSKEKLEENK